MRKYLLLLLLVFLIGCQSVEDITENITKEVIEQIGNDTPKVTIPTCDQEWNILPPLGQSSQDNIST